MSGAKVLIHQYQNGPIDLKIVLSSGKQVCGVHLPNIDNLGAKSLELGMDLADYEIGPEGYEVINGVQGGEISCEEIPGRRVDAKKLDLIKNKLLEGIARNSNIS